LQILYPSELSKSYFSSDRLMSLVQSMTTLSINENSEDHLNSSSSVKGLAGAVLALRGIP